MLVQFTDQIVFLDTFKILNLVKWACVYTAQLLCLTFINVHLQLDSKSHIREFSGSQYINMFI